MKRFAGLVACGLMAFSLAASAEQGGGAGPGKHGERFKTADADGDGKLSPTEFATFCKGGKSEKKFAAADTDKDGFLTKEELKAAHKGHGGKKGNQPAP